MATRGSGDELAAARPAPAMGVQGDGGASPSRVGEIVLARHGEPDISRKVSLSARAYVAWWARYEETGLRPGQTAPEGLRAFAGSATAVLSSSRPRAIESARALVGDRAVEVNADLIEAPLPPPHWPDWLKLRPRSWGVVSRFVWWFCDHHDGQEPRARAQARADAVADRLIGLAEGGDVLVVAHGFFNAMIGRSLKSRGWSLAQDQGFHYWSLRRYVSRRG